LLAPRDQKRPVEGTGQFASDHCSGEVEERRPSALGLRLVEVDGHDFTAVERVPTQGHALEEIASISRAADEV
jgi:hypothetical protein